MASQDWLEKDFYKLLEVSKDASDAEIKKSYRKLARKYHPDTHPGDAVAEGKFKQISEAYAVLSDKDSRAEYDQIRALGAGGPRFTASGAGGNSGAGGFEDLLGGMFGGRARRGGSSGGFEDLFGMFGAGQQPSSGYGAGYPGPNKGSDVKAQVTLDFKDAAAGTTMKLQTSAGKQLTVKIPAGVSDGQKIRLAGKGRPGVNGGPAGDMIVEVSVRKHPVFSRDGNNLRLQVPISVVEALLGATIEVPTLDGGTVKLKVPAGTSSGKVLRVKGRGIQTAKATGDLLATLEIVVPSILEQDAATTVQKLAEQLPVEDPRASLIAKAR